MDENYGTAKEICHQSRQPVMFIVFIIITHTGYNTYMYTATYNAYKTSTYTYIIYNTLYSIYK